MFNRAFIAASLGMAALVFGAIPQLKAGDLDNKMTTMTFSAPVEISGEALPAGTYVFKTLNDERNVVEVMNAEQNHLVGLFNTIPVQAAAIPDKTEVNLSPGVPKGPEVLHTWFYPGYSIGWEFPAAPVNNK